MPLCWEGIEDDRDTVTPVWFTRTIKNTDDEDSLKNALLTPAPLNEWKPLRSSDCKALNKFVPHSEGDIAVEAENTERKDMNRVLVDGGRSTAYPSSQRVIENFGRSPRQSQLASATWFAVTNPHPDSKDSSFPSPTESLPIPQLNAVQPIFNVSDSLLIEGLYQTIKHATSISESGLASVLKETITLSDNSTVQVKCLNDVLTLRWHRPGNWTDLRGLTRSPPVLQRGYGPYMILGADDEETLGDVAHVIFLIHGIGEDVWRRDSFIAFPSWVETAQQLRRSANKLLVERWRDQCMRRTTSHLPTPPGRFEYLPIEWHDELHHENRAWVQTLKSTTLPTIPTIRAIANDVILDVLFYMTPSFGYAVLNGVTQQIDEQYKQFLSIHPGYKGTWSLVGHSLGSVICWDLLALKKQHDHSWPDAEEAVEPKATPDGKRKEDPPETASHLTSMAPTCATVAGEVTDKTETSPSALESVAWGPSLSEPMTKFLPFEPDYTIFLGSPVGMFLTLRGAHGVFDRMRSESSVDAYIPESPKKNKALTVSPFRLPTKALFNIYHPSDPVAYRIEPLLLRQGLKPDRLPRPEYLTAPGRDVRFHVKAQQLSHEIRKNFKAQQTTFNTFFNTAVATISTSLSSNAQARAGPDGVSQGPPDEDADEDTLLARAKFPLGGTSPRVDFSLQPGVIDSEYLSAVSAHAVYFTHSDVRDFIVGLLSNDPSASAMGGKN